MSGQTYRVTVRATDSTGAEAFIDVIIEVEPHQYDLNGNGHIDLTEVSTAIDDYFDGQLTLDEVSALIDLYFS